MVYFCHPDVGSTPFLRLHSSMLIHSFFSLDVETSDTIESVKQQLEKMYGFTVDEQRLCIETKSLRNWPTLAQCHIGADATMHMTLRRPRNPSRPSTKATVSVYETNCHANPRNMPLCAFSLHILHLVLVVFSPDLCLCDRSQDSLPVCDPSNA